MTLAESLDYFSFVVQVGTNVAVAFYVLPMWRQRRLRFFAILGFSALLGVFTSVTSHTLARNPMSEHDYYWFWCASTFLGIVDLILYAVGILLMVHHFQSAAASTPPPSQDQ